MHVGDQLVDRLIGYGVRYIFGCPGGQTLPLYNGIAKRPGEITHVLMRDERSGIYAADGYARATGHIGVCDATTGPGASNLVSGLAETRSSSIPVMAIVSDIRRDWEHRRRYAGTSQGFEQQHFLEPCVKWLGRVETTNNLPDILQTCLRIATSGRAGPTVLEIPDDVFSDNAVEANFAPNPGDTIFPRYRCGAEPEALAAAVARLSASEMPMIIVGGGARQSGAGEAIAALAELLGAPFATTLSGKGTVPETHPLSVGVVGRFGVPMANKLLSSATCTVFIGCKTGREVTLDWGIPDLDSPVIHLDLDPEEIGRNFRDTVGVMCDARTGVRQLVEALRGVDRKNGWDLERITAIQREWWDGPIEFKQEPSGVLKAQEVVRAMSNAMDAEDSLVCDASLSSGWGGGRFRTRRMGKNFFAPRGLAGLGWGLPAAIGVATAQRGLGGARVACLAGDGAWAYSLGEIETCARMGLPVISVVLNNSTLGWIKHARQGRYPDTMLSEDFLEVDFAESAHGLGANVERVRELSEFEAAFGKALKDGSSRPWVIEAITDDIETPVQRSLTASPGQGGY